MQYPLTDIPEVPHKEEITPEGYKGLAGFHKYWGKKPVEHIQFLLDKLTFKNDLVFDPFLGSALTLLEVFKKKRRFIGCDINPISIEFGKFFSNMPSQHEYYSELKKIEFFVKNQINESYTTEDGRVATHYLWEESSLKLVMQLHRGREGRKECPPSDLDLSRFELYKSYKSSLIRDIKSFNNSRINSYADTSLQTLFTGRALRNIDLILKAILEIKKENVKRSFLLTLTSAIGQMSNMVFAINKRGKKTDNIKTDKYEVGSWVIGYWCPKLHFEINVWNCFANKTSKLLKALPANGLHIPMSSSFYSGSDERTSAFLYNCDCRTVMGKIDQDSIDFIITDPPHSDRIPYLELSEVWNAILSYSPDFEGEIIVSNAKLRSKSISNYNNDMLNVFSEFYRILKPGKMLAFMFNASDKESWNFFKKQVGKNLNFVGCFDLNYSAGSVVQDNRDNSLKHDYVLLFTKGGNIDSRIDLSPLQALSGWSTQLPTPRG